MSRAALTTRRLLGIDRSGPRPPETLPGAPLNPWTIPNAIGFVRLALIPVFLYLALGSGDGRLASASIVYAVIGGSDYLDGIAARVTGQYSRLGVLLDPVTDRLLVMSGVIVCWHFDLLPRWALGILAAREVLMLGVSQIGLWHGVD
ncbi:MAG: CDP-alcohol phosphatidyltransferase family protein, partial [Thermoleophilaceae bacterium]